MRNFTLEIHPVGGAFSPSQYCTKGVAWAVSQTRVQILESDEEFEPITVHRTWGKGKVLLQLRVLSTQSGALQQGDSSPLSTAWDPE